MNSNTTNWYLRKPDGSEYGPITTYDLQRWAKQCRIVAGNGVSADREEWIKVEDIPELEMDWVAHRPDGKEYGPFNISATQELLDHKVLSEDATLTHKITHKSVTVEQVLNEEDLFDEPDQEDQPQDDNYEQDLSEEALKEEEMYVGEQQTEPAEKPPSHSDSQPKEAPISDKLPTTPATSDSQHPASASPSPQIEKLEEKLQKTKSDLSQTRKELKASKQETSEIIESLTEERDQAQSSLTALQTKLEKLKQKQINNSEAHTAQYEELETKLKDSTQKQQQAESKLLHLENERSNAEDQSLKSVAELRKQTAFMKKNSATLQHELEKSRSIASKRGRQLAIIITAIGIVAGIILLTGKPGCRKTNEDTTSKPQQPVTETSEDTPLSQRTYNDTHAPSTLPSPPSQTHTPTHTQTPPSSLWPKTIIKGVKVTDAGHTRSIRFDSGVFTTMTTPSTEAISQLNDLADTLRPHMNKFRIIIEGCTDNTPMRKTATYDGNHALGLARAETIKKLLITKGRLPGNSITARYAGENNAPYPNDTALNRKRNRTVVLKLVKK